MSTLEALLAVLGPLPAVCQGGPPAMTPPAPGRPPALLECALRPHGQGSWSRTWERNWFHLFLQQTLHRTLTSGVWPSAASGSQGSSEQRAGGRGRGALHLPTALAPAPAPFLPHSWKKLESGREVSG